MLLRHCVALLVFALGPLGAVAQGKNITIVALAKNAYPDIRVSGAGLAIVNGIYEFKGLHHCKMPLYYLKQDSSVFHNMLWWHHGSWHLGHCMDDSGDTCSIAYTKKDGHDGLNGCDDFWQPDGLGPLSSTGTWDVGQLPRPNVALASSPPPPPPPPTKQWPVFLSMSALQSDPWGKYYQTVYGELPGQASYPLEVKSNWMIYDQVLITSKVKDNIPASVGECPTANPPAGQRYNINNMYSPPFLSWVWHPYPYSALAANTWVEVLHEADPFGDENYGAWFVYAPGSGIYFNTGSTISFSEHADAYVKFGVTPGAQMNDRLSQAAAARGFDSIQFLAHVDHTNYQCDTTNTGNAGLEYMGLEIVGAKLEGKYACGASNDHHLRSGWAGSKPCVCDNRKQYLNCQGLPTLEAVPQSTGRQVFV